jgi:DNA invertase Pin-like site-specific DNA recombinase
VRSPKRGLARAVDEGKVLGRPMVDAKKEAAVRAALAKSHGMMRVAKMVGVGTGTVQRIKAEMSAAT